MNIKSSDKSKNDGFTLLELLVAVVIIGILALIASATLFNAVDRAKDAAVKANISAASSSLTTQLSVEEKLPDQAVEDTLISLNNPDGEEDSGDEVRSPYDKALDAFLDGDSGEKGQVALDGNDETFIVTIRGFGKKGDGADPISVKTVNKIEE